MAPVTTTKAGSLSRTQARAPIVHTSAAAALWRRQKEYRASQTTRPLARRSSSVSEPSLDAVEDRLHSDGYDRRGFLIWQVSRADDPSTAVD
jgi:hypothetical protein